APLVDRQLRAGCDTPAGNRGNGRLVRADVRAPGHTGAQRSVKHGAVAATTLFAGTFALFFSLATYRFSDDHFHRISSARQVLRYGERAFRDFFDPGYVLTEGASAAVQLVFGDNLFGEMMLNSAFVVAGALAIFLLARRASGSL